MLRDTMGRYFARTLTNFRPECPVIILQVEEMVICDRLQDGVDSKYSLADDVNLRQWESESGNVVHL